MSEKRKFVGRQACHNLSLFDRKTGDFLGRVVNMSINGLMLVSDQPIEFPKLYECKIELPEEILESRELIFDAESKWCNKNDELNCYETGFLLRNLSEKVGDIVRLLMHEKMAENTNTKQVRTKSNA
ncbi:MAG: PilZ domain-containing protein [Candidatus Zixiibacteriota bacterium]